MEINYTVRYLEEVVNTHMPSLPPSACYLIKRTIQERLMVDPLSYGKPLRYSLKGHRCLRVSDYRIIYRIEPATKTVIVVAIKHRKCTYKNA